MQFALAVANKDKRSEFFGSFLCDIVKSSRFQLYNAIEMNRWRSYMNDSILLLTGTLSGEQVVCPQ